MQVNCVFWEQEHLTGLELCILPACLHFACQSCSITWPPFLENPSSAAVDMSVNSPEKCIISRSCHKYTFCHDKRFVMTNMWQVCCDKTHLLLRQAYFCHNKRHVLSQQTHVLSQQKWYLWHLLLMLKVWVAVTISVTVRPCFQYELLRLLLLLVTFFFLFFTFCFLSSSAYISAFLFSVGTVVINVCRFLSLLRLMFS